MERMVSRMEKKDKPEYKAGREYIITLEDQNPFDGSHPIKSVTELVRCKDCKFAREPQRDCREEADACEGILVCWNGSDTVFAEEIGWRFVNDDFFCGDGKRKDGENDAP